MSVGSSGSGVGVGVANGSTGVGYGLGVGVAHGSGVGVGVGVGIPEPVALADPPALIPITTAAANNTAANDRTIFLCIMRSTSIIHDRTNSASFGEFANNVVLFPDFWRCKRSAALNC